MLAQHARRFKKEITQRSSSMIHQVIPIIPKCQAGGLWAELFTKQVGFANQKQELSLACGPYNRMYLVLFKQIASLIFTLRKMDRKRIKEAKSKRTERYSKSGRFVEVHEDMRWEGKQMRDQKERRKCVPGHARESFKRNCWKRRG